MKDDFSCLFIEAPELGKFLFSCKPIHMYSNEEVMALNLDLRINTGELRYRIQARNLNTQAVGTGEENYEKF